MAILNVDAAVTRLSQVPSCFRILPAAASATTVHTTSAWAAENDKAEHSAAKTAVRFNMVAILIQHPNGLTARPSSAMAAAVPLARPADRRRLAGLLGSPARSCVRTPASFRHARSAGFQLRAENAAPEQEAGQNAQTSELVRGGRVRWPFRWPHRHGTSAARAGEKAAEASIRGEAHRARGENAGGRGGRGARGRQAALHAVPHTPAFAPRARDFGRSRWGGALAEAAGGGRGRRGRGGGRDHVRAASVARGPDQSAAGPEPDRGRARGRTGDRPRVEACLAGRLIRYERVLDRG